MRLKDVYREYVGSDATHLEKRLATRYMKSLGVAGERRLQLGWVVAQYLLSSGDGIQTEIAAIGCLDLRGCSVD